MYLQMELTVNPIQRTQPMTTVALVSYTLVNLCLAVYGTATA